MKVSVCMVTYNHEPFIRQAVESALAQKTDFDYEIVIGEDCSTDGTRAVLQQLDREHPGRLRLLLRDRNLGMMPNAMATLADCNGDYIASLEGDDYWTDQGKLQKQAEILDKHPSIIACHHWHTCRYENGLPDAGTPLEGYLPRDVSTVREIFANRMRVKTRTVMFRNVFQQIPFPDWVHGMIAGDVPFSMILGKYGDFYFLDQSMAVYRITGKGVSPSGKSYNRQQWIAYRLDWLKIWEYGNAYHDFAYTPETAQTVSGYYGEVCRFMTFPRLKFLLILAAHLGRRRNPLGYRLRVAPAMVRDILLSNGRSCLERLRQVAFQVKAGVRGLTAR